MDAADFVIYGVSWTTVMAVAIALLRRYTSITPEVEKIIAAVGAVVGFLLITNLAQLELLWPAMPVIIPQVLTAILIFGATLGLVPGETTVKLFAKMRGKK